MTVQYISDGSGKTAGVFIPIQQWNELKEKLRELSSWDEALLPTWHMSIVRERLDQHTAEPHLATDTDQALDDIDTQL